MALSESSPADRWFTKGRGWRRWRPV